MAFNAENLLLRAKLQELQRVKKFETGWLKRNQPVVYAMLKEASEANDERYLHAEMKKFDDRFHKH